MYKQHFSQSYLAWSKDEARMTNIASTEIKALKGIRRKLDLIIPTFLALESIRLALLVRHEE